MDEQRIGMLLKGPIECLLYFRFGAGIDNYDFDADAVTGVLEGFCIGGVRILGIDQHGNGRRLGIQQPEQLDALRSQLAVDEGYPCDIAARTVEAGDQPVLDRVAAVGKHDWYACRRRLGGERGDHASGRKDCIDRTIDQFCCERGQSVVLIVRPAIVDQEILLLHITALVQALVERGYRRLIVSLSRAAEKSKRQHPRLLRARRERPPSRRAPEQRDEIAPSHSITSSARASNVAGTSRPRLFAVLRLIASSYLVGACTGRSAGFSPLRMRST